MKVKNMTSNNGNKVANQFIIETEDAIYFQSYETVIAKKTRGKLILDEDKWDYSKTTAKYRNIFTGLTTSETKKRIKTGQIELANLN